MHDIAFDGIHDEIAVSFRQSKAYVGFKAFNGLLFAVLGVAILVRICDHFILSLLAFCDRGELEGSRRLCSICPDHREQPTKRVLRFGGGHADDLWSSVCAFPRENRPRIAECRGRNRQSHTACVCRLAMAEQFIE